MTTPETILIVGVGSAHGDDQAGWLVADELSRRVADRSFVSVRKASVPLDLLDWLENVNVLHLIDAYDVAGCPARLCKFRWLNGQMICQSDNAPSKSVLNQQSARSSHGFSVPDVLRLAEKTGLLPEKIVIWAIPGSDFQTGDRMSEQCRNNICKAATEIVAELGVAYA